MGEFEDNQASETERVLLVMELNFYLSKADEVLNKIREVGASSGKFNKMEQNLQDFIAITRSVLQNEKLVQTQILENMVKRAKELGLEKA